ncbi:hypothetical protein AB205_0201120, partial [Aquarana catesbeiana]
PFISGYARVVNGENAFSGSWPWQVSIQDSTGFHYCGGSIINSLWVVTAAHCGVTSSHRVVPSEFDFSSNAEPIQVKSNVRYNAPTADSDIALIKLSSPVTLNDRVSPVCLSASSDVFKEGESCVTSGWGCINGVRHTSYALVLSCCGHPAACFVCQELRQWLLCKQCLKTIYRYHR